MAPHMIRSTLACLRATARAIAAELKISRNTPRKYMAMSADASAKPCTSDLRRD